MTILYGFPAGGLGDVLMRIVGSEITKATGQPVIVDVRVGASGRLPLLALAKARGDGHTLAFINNGNTVSLPLVDTAFKMDPVKDYTPLCLMVDAPYVFVVTPALGVKDLKGLIDYAKANPGKLNFAIGSVGGLSHLTNEMLRERTKIEFVNVPYKGNIPAMQALVAGEAQVYLSSSQAKPFTDSGRLVAIATTGAKRWPLYPNVPTLDEQGFQFEVGVWLGMAGPTDLTPEVKARLNTLLNTAIRAPEFATKIREEGWVLNQLSVDAFASYIRADLERWGPLVRKLGIKPES